MKAAHRNRVVLLSGWLVVALLLGSLTLGWGGERAEWVAYRLGLRSWTGEHVSARHGDEPGQVSLSYTRVFGPHYTAFFVYVTLVAMLAHSLGSGGSRAWTLFLVFALAVCLLAFGELQVSGLLDAIGLKQGGEPPELMYYLEEEWMIRGISGSLSLWYEPNLWGLALYLAGGLALTAAVQRRAAGDTGYPGPGPRVR